MNITKSKTAKVVAGLLGAAMSLSFVFSSVAGAQALSPAELALLQSLLARYQSTQTTTTATAGYTFSQDLTIGSTGADVLALQKFLNASGFPVASSGAGSPGNESTYFGAKTQAAVSAFQVAKGISPTAGYFGPKTRSVVNAMEESMGGTTTTTTTTGGTTTSGVAGSLVVSNPSTQPSNSLAPQGAARVPFTKFTLTAGASDVVVNSVTVQRSALAQDAVFAGVVLLDPNGIQIGIAKTLNSNHQASIGDSGFTVKAGTSETFTVAGNLNTNLAAYAGQVAELDVVAINTSATVSGALPITGSQQTVNASLTLGTASAILSSFDPGTATTKQIGTTAYRFSGIRITAGSAEQVDLQSVRWNQTGSVSSSDLANVSTFVNGVAYPTTVDSTGKYYTSTFGSGIVIDKGFSADIYIQGDIVGSDAAGRTVEFDIYKTTDIYLSGVTYGYGITPTGTGGQFSTGTPFFKGNLVSVTAGSATTISNAPSVPAQNVAINVPNQPLGGFSTSIVGEPISVQSTTFTITTSGTETLPIRNVSIVDQNGSVVAGPVDAVISGATTTQTLNFTDTITLPIGSDTFTLKGTIPAGYANGTIVTVSTTPTNWTNVTGQVTGNTITLPSTPITLNQMTVKAASLNVSVSTTPTAQTVVAGGQQVLFANVQLDASQSGEDVRTSSIPLTLTNGGTGYQNDLSSCQLWNGATALNTGTNVVNPTNPASPSATENLVFTLDQSLTVPKGTVLTLAVSCNLSSNATAGHTYAFTYSAGTPLTATGVTSSQSVAVTGSGTGATMTAGSGSLVVSADASTPSYTVASAGTQGVTLGVIKFHSASQTTNLQQISLILTSGSPKDLSQVSIVDPSTNTVVGTATFTGNSLTATSTLSQIVVLPQDADKTLVIKGNLADISATGSGVEGDLIQVNVNGADTFGTKGTGGSSGTQLYASGSTAFTGVRMFNTFPTFAQDTLQSTGLADGNLIHFHITADSAADVGVAQFRFLIASTSGVTITNVNLFAYSDPAYSQGVTPVGGSITAQLDNSNIATVVSGTAFTVPVTAAGGGQSMLEIPAGQTRYFALKGSVAGVVSGSSVTTTLLGDSVFSGVNTEAMVASSTYSFIWSANATSTSATTTVDWSNGYGLPGLPSSGIIQTRSQ